jgi:hypothetical protein
MGEAESPDRFHKFEGTMQLFDGFIVGPVTSLA